MEILSGSGFEDSKRITQLHLTIQREKYSPEINELWDCVEKNNPNVEIVKMGECKSIQAMPTDEHAKLIWTYDVAGCFVILIFSKDEGLRKTITIGHINPLAMSEAGAAIGHTNPFAMSDSRLGEHNLAISSSEVHSRKVIIFARTELDDDSSLQDKRKAELANLMENLEEAGIEESPEVIPYQIKNYNGKDKGIIAARINPGGIATYKTWFNEGVLE